jgi:putative ABC transport system ATP-binding protein
VAVARALVAKPKIILADEPTGNLDTKHGEEVMNLLVDLHKEGTTIVIVTHSPDYAKKAQRIIRLLDGNVLSEEAGNGVESSPAGPGAELTGQQV